MNEWNTLYKIDSKGKLRQWTITVVNRGFESEIIISAGLVEGKKTFTNIHITEGKNIGKSNETSHYTQAISQAQSKYDGQIRDGYVENIADAKQAILASGLPQCMLAHKFDSSLKQSNSKNLDKLNLKGEKIYIQAKLDGNRCLTEISSKGEVKFYTRKGDLMLPIPHIEEQLSNTYLQKGFTDCLILDGELYTDKLPFNTLNGLIRKQSKTEKDLGDLKLIDYVVYDTYNSQGYEKRFEIVKEFESENVKIIPNFEIIANDESIKEKLDCFLSQGYEGAILRVLGKPYEYKRSWNLMKIKEFEDSEFEILDVELDSIGRLGAFIMKMDIPVLDKDGKLVETFKAGITGIDHEKGLEIIRNKEKYIGKTATVIYFGRDVRPRFPKIKLLDRMD